MKRLALFFSVAVLMCAGSATADIFECMDCSERGVSDPNGGHIEASCCMSQNGHCYERDVIKDWDVGSGCRISDPSTFDDSTGCISDKNFDPKCGGGGKTGRADLFQGDQGCVSDQYGWCDIPCMSCA